jgi:hypothetical protein
LIDAPDTELRCQRHDKIRGGRLFCLGEYGFNLPGMVAMAQTNMVCLAPIIRFALWDECGILNNFV